MQELKNKLKEEAQMLHDTIEWWKVEMHKVMSDCSSMERKYSKGEFDYDELQTSKENLEDRLQYLLLKGEWENRELAAFHKKLQSLEKSGLKLGIENIGFKIHSVKKVEDKDQDFNEGEF
tara:strand:- start:728 stop:1087 length:360 start_codon:yes stop_codon:yes gene_type:complete